MPRKKTKVTDETKTIRSLDERIAATKALLAKYEQQKLTESILNNIEVGDDVDFLYGRSDSGEGRRTLTGKVTVGLTADESWGNVVGVFAGEGFDAKSYKVRVKDIKANRTAAQRDAAAPKADKKDPLDV